MIIDSLSNSVLYEQINPYFKKAFDYLKQSDLSALETGKIILVPDILAISVSNSKLKVSQDAILETHNQFIDIQIPINRPETFGWKQKSTCSKVDIPYSSEKDIEFYNDSPSVHFTLQPGEFAVFFPGDAHAPCIGEGEVKKIVIKVKY